LLHYGATFFDELGSVLGSAERIGNAVCELVLDDFRCDADFLMQDRPSHYSEAIVGNFGFVS
jgi:hypothetical protein